MRVTRGLLGAAGSSLVARRRLAPARHAACPTWSTSAVWLAGGVLLHDAVLAPAGRAAGAPGRCRGCRRGAAPPRSAGFVVLGPVTLLAIPVIGRFGAREDVPAC